MFFPNLYNISLDERIKILEKKSNIEKQYAKV